MIGMDKWYRLMKDQQNFPSFSIKEESMIDRQTDFFQPDSKASQQLIPNLISSTPKNITSFLYLELTYLTMKNPIGTKARQTAPRMVIWIRYLLTLQSYFLLRASQDWAIPTKNTISPTTRKPIMMQAGMVSYIWYLSCSPSDILLSMVIMILTRPSIQARGTQRSKSLAFLKVTVQPKESNMKSTISTESETACSRRQNTSKTPCSTPESYAYTTNPMYLNKIEQRPMDKLTFRVSLIQLSPSSSLSLCRRQRMTEPESRRRGRSQPQSYQEEEQCFQLLRTSIQTSNLAYLPYPSFVSLLEHSLRTKLQVSSEDIDTLEAKVSSKFLSQLRQALKTISFLLKCSACYWEKCWVLHLCWRDYSQMDQGIATSYRSQRAPCLQLLLRNLMVDLRFICPGSSRMRSTQLQLQERRKAGTENCILCCFWWVVQHNNSRVASMGANPNLLFNITW